MPGHVNMFGNQALGGGAAQGREEFQERDQSSSGSGTTRRKSLEGKGEPWKRHQKAGQAGASWQVGSTVAGAAVASSDRSSSIPLSVHGSLGTEARLERVLERVGGEEAETTL